MIADMKRIHFTTLLMGGLLATRLAGEARAADEVVTYNRPHSSDPFG